MCEQVPCKCSFALKPVDTVEELYAGDVGSFIIVNVTPNDAPPYKRLMFKHAIRGGEVHSLPLYLKGHDKPAVVGAAWEWDGNPTYPTLAPSLLCYAYPSGEVDSRTEGWHGFIVNGYAKSL